MIQPISASSEKPFTTPLQPARAAALHGLSHAPTTLAPAALSSKKCCSFTPVQRVLYAIKECFHSFLSKIKALLQRNNRNQSYPSEEINIYAPLDSFGNSALQLACLTGNEAKASALIDQSLLINCGAAVHDVTRWGSTPLHQVNNPRIAEKLLQAHADPNARNLLGETPLHVACAENKTSIIEPLIQGGASLQALDHRGNTPLHFTRNLQAAELLLRAGASAQATNHYRQTPLHTACDRLKSCHDLPNTEHVLLLIRSGASVLATDENFNTSLHLATDPDIISALIQNGASALVTNQLGETPLHSLCQRSQSIPTSSVCAERLLQAGAPINAVDQAGNTPLLLAHDLEIIEVLLRAGARTDAVNHRQETHLHRLCLYSSSGTLPSLDGLEAVNANGDTPLHLPCTYNQQAAAAKMTRLLSAPNAPAVLNARNNQGRTPLHEAYRFGCEEVVRTLIAAGATTDVQDNEGRTPEQLARAH